jgi:hypothetical protein
MCCVLFSGLGSYMLCVATGVIPSISYRIPSGCNPYVFEICIHIATEFLPCATLLYFTRRKDDSMHSKIDVDITDNSSSVLLLPHLHIRTDDVPYQYQVFDFQNVFVHLCR